MRALLFQEIGTWRHPILRVGHKMANMWVGNLLTQLREGTLCIPEYQRGRVWTNEQKSNWVGFMLSQMPLPAIWIREVNVSSGAKDELLDGQQRFTACLEWLDGQIPATLWDGREVWYQEGYEKALYRLTMPTCRIPWTATDEDAILVYLAINTGGTPHTEEDLAPAREYQKRLRSQSE